MVSYVYFWGVVQDGRVVLGRGVAHDLGNVHESDATAAM